MKYQKELTTNNEQEFIDLLIDQYNDFFQSFNVTVNLEPVVSLIYSQDNENYSQDFLSYLSLIITYKDFLDNNSVEEMLLVSSNNTLKNIHDEDNEFNIIFSMVETSISSISKEDKNFFKTFSLAFENGKEKSLNKNISNYFSSLSEDEKVYFILGEILENINKKFISYNCSYDKIDNIFLNISRKLMEFENDSQPIRPKKHFKY